MSELNERELAAFESELRRFRPRAAAPLPLRSALLSSWKRRFAAVAAIAVFAVVALWMFRAVHHDAAKHTTTISEPLTEIRARAALANGADVDDLAPIPVNRQHGRGISALDVLSQE